MVSLLSSHLLLSGFWLCDQNRTQFHLEILCEQYQCADKTDESFCECGRGRWKCPTDGKCINSSKVCDKSDEGCHCQHCADEQEEFCHSTSSCVKGSVKISGVKSTAQDSCLHVVHKNVASIQLSCFSEMTIA